MRILGHKVTVCILERVLHNETVVRQERAASVLQQPHYAAAKKEIASKWPATFKPTVWTEEQTSYGLCITVFSTSSHA